MFSVTPIKNSQKGVTLFELMVTIILAGIMMTGAVLIYSQFMDLWNKGNVQLEAQRQGTYALGVMERNIKQGNDYKIENYGSGIDNKITVKNIPTQTVSQTIVAKEIVYYWDENDTAYYQPIKENKDAQEIIIIPDTYTYIEGGAGKSDFTVEDLTFTPEDRLDADGEIVARSVRIDLKLKSPDVEQPFDFTISARLRNENVD